MREAKAPEKPGNCRVMHRDTFGIGQRIAQLKECDIRVLGHQFFKEPDMRGQLASSGRTPHRRDTGFAGAADLARPPHARGRRHLKPTCRFPTRQAIPDQSRKPLPERTW